MCYGHVLLSELPIPDRSDRCDSVVFDSYAGRSVVVSRLVTVFIEFTAPKIISQVGVVHVLWVSVTTEVTLLRVLLA